jgi:hypothetical protein
VTEYNNFHVTIFRDVLAVNIHNHAGNIANNKHTLKDRSISSLTSSEYINSQAVFLLDYCKWCTWKMVGNIYTANRLILIMRSIKLLALSIMTVLVNLEKELSPNIYIYIYIYF